MQRSSYLLTEQGISSDEGADELHTRLERREAAARFEMMTFLAALTGAARSSQARALLASANSSPLDVVKHGSIPRCSKGLLVVVQGCVFSSRSLPNGRRQILKLLAPGELCNLWVLYSDDVDMDLIATTSSRLVRLPLDLVKALPEVEIARILEATLACEYLLMIETIFMLCRRTARERVTYFLLDLVDRLQRSGLALDDNFDLDMSQGEMGDALGLSTVHINRTLTDLKVAGMIRIQGRRCEIIERAALEAAVSFKSRASVTSSTSFTKVYPMTCL